MKIAHEIGSRVNKIEEESVSWINSYCELLKLKPTKISLPKKEPDTISISFKSEKEAKVFKSHMMRAGNLIPFFPKRMIPFGDENTDSTNLETQDLRTVSLKREIPIHFDLKQIENYFTFVQMHNDDGSITNDYRKVLDERALGVLEASVKPSFETTNIERTFSDIPIAQKLPLFVGVAEKLISIKSMFEKDRALQNAYISSLFRSKNISKRKAL